MHLAQPQQLSPTVLAALESAQKSRVEGNLDLAIKGLEAELDQAPEKPDLIQFMGRVSLAMAIAELHVAAGERDRALRVLAAEIVAGKTTFQNVKAVGTDEEKRLTFRGLVQMRDLHTPIELFGKQAPEIVVKEWINGPATSLADLRGQVVVLEFWATWCKPCEQMFPKLKALHEDYAPQGLVILALTRYFLAYGRDEKAQLEELALIRNFVEKHGFEFPVGVSEDEHTQMLFGAMGLPIIVLIDRRGIVRLITVSTEDERFQLALNECLNQSNKDS